MLEAGVSCRPCARVLPCPLVPAPARACLVPAACARPRVRRGWHGSTPHCKLLLTHTHTPTACCLAPLCPAVAFVVCIRVCSGASVGCAAWAATPVLLVGKKFVSALVLCTFVHGQVARLCSTSSWAALREQGAWCVVWCAGRFGHSAASVRLLSLPWPPAQQPAQPASAQPPAASPRTATSAMHRAFCTPSIKRGRYSAAATHWPCASAAPAVHAAPRGKADAGLPLDDTASARQGLSAEEGHPLRSERHFTVGTMDVVSFF